MEKQIVVYPVVIDTNLTDNYYDVYVPNLEINTEGESIPNAIEMAREAIALKCISNEDLKQPTPEPTNNIEKIKHSSTEIVTLVDVDIADYKKKNDLRTIRKNVSIPAYLDFYAKKEKINVSALLTNALKRELNLL